MRCLIDLRIAHPALRPHVPGHTLFWQATTKQACEGCDCGAWVLVRPHNIWPHVHHTAPPVLPKPKQKLRQPRVHHKTHPPSPSWWFWNWSKTAHPHVVVLRARQVLGKIGLGYWEFQVIMYDTMTPSTWHMAHAINKPDGHTFSGKGEWFVLRCPNWAGCSAVI